VETGEDLGRLLYLDQQLSANRNQSCASCHSLTPARDPSTGSLLRVPGFVDPDNVELGTPTSRGSRRGSFGALNAPSAAYAAFSPFFHWNGTEGLYVGGQFWNGRSATLADQAGQPFLNPVEMAMPSRWAVVSRLRESSIYREAFRSLYGIDLARIRGFERAPADAKPPAAVLVAYEAMTRAIAAFEKTRTFNRFDSKFDFVQAGVTDLDAEESLGLALFNGEALCSACHPAERTTAPGGGAFAPLFTDFTYDNLGLPRNVAIAGNRADRSRGRADVRSGRRNEFAKHKVMLRSRDLPPTGTMACSTLNQIVHFYNTRDVLGASPTTASGLRDPRLARARDDSEREHRRARESRAERGRGACSGRLPDDAHRWLSRVGRGSARAPRHAIALCTDSVPSVSVREPPANPGRFMG
jgi:cytochrome c peroxidase